MRWFGFRLYQASLWAPDGRWQAAQPYALELRYVARHSLGASGAGQHRGDAAPGQRRRCPPGALESSSWSESFRMCASGEVIHGLHLPQRGAEFYHQGRLTGRIEDVEFARAFFAIWLDPRTREPGLRASLLGAG
jgi:hypothetical protein